MTKRLDIMNALKAALEAAFPGAVVSYWRDRPPIKRDDTSVYVVFRDVGGSIARINTEHEHRVRVEIEALAFGDNLGAVMNDQLDQLIRAIGADPTLGQSRTACEVAAFAYDTAGDGFEGGVAQLILEVVYRTKVWSGV